MGRKLLVVALALVGLLSAAGMGVAAYWVSKDSVAVPITHLQSKPQLAPPDALTTTATRTRSTRTTATSTRTTSTHRETSGDDSGTPEGDHDEDD